MLQKTVADFTNTFFNNCENACAKAEIYKLAIAEFNIKLFLFDPGGKFELESLKHALSVFNIDTDIAEYSVYLIDAEHCNDLLPAKFWGIEDIEADQSIKGFAEENIFTLLDNNGIFSLVDRGRKRAIQVFGLDNILLPHGDYFYPLRRILNQFIIDTDYVLVHAGGLGAIANENGVIITGKGGSGKSTICGLSVGGDVAYVGDDFLLIDTKQCYAYCLYTSLNARKHLVGFFDDHSIFKKHPKDGTLKLNNSEPGRINLILPVENYHYLKRRIKIRAILKPIYDPDIKQLLSTPISAPAMIRYMAGSTLYITNGGAATYEKNFLKMCTLVKQVQGYEFYYNSDTEQIRTSIGQITCQNQ